MHIESEIKMESEIPEAEINLHPDLIDVKYDHLIDE